MGEIQKGTPDPSILIYHLPTHRRVVVGGADDIPQALETYFNTTIDVAPTRLCKCIFYQGFLFMSLRAVEQINTDRRDIKPYAEKVIFRLDIKSRNAVEFYPLEAGVCYGVPLKDFDTLLSQREPYLWYGEGVYKLASTDEWPTEQELQDYEDVYLTDIPW